MVGVADRSQRMGGVEETFLPPNRRPLWADRPQNLGGVPPGARWRVVHRRGVQVSVGGTGILGQVGVHICIAQDLCGCTKNQSFLNQDPSSQLSPTLSPKRCLKVVFRKRKCGNECIAQKSLFSLQTINFQILWSFATVYPKMKVIHCIEFNTALPRVKSSQ